jgi:hypothetical protein
MPNIPFPNVPEYPGVPPLLRQANSAIAAIPALAIGIGTLEGILGNALQQPLNWGIFDSLGNQLGGSSTSGNSILGALAAQLTGNNAPVLSTLSFDFTREAKVSDFIIEQGSFASFNKVQNPANPVVTLAFSGSQDDRTNFLNAIDAACISTDLFSVVTPEVTYVNYSLERYSISRRGDRGATLLVVEISLKEIREVSATFTQSLAMPILNPQNASATTPTNNGLTQPGANDSTLLKGARIIGLGN